MANVEAQSLHLKALPADEVLEKLRAIGATFPRSCQINWNIATNVTPLTASGSVSQSDALVGDPNIEGFITQVRGKRHVLCRLASLQATHNNQPLKISYTCDDGLKARVEIAAANVNQGLELLQAVEAHLTVVPYVDLVGAGPVAAVERAAMTARERSVADLREEVARLATFLSELTQREVENRREFQKQVELDYRRKADDLEAEHKAKLAVVDERRRQIEDDVTAREQAFQAKIEAFNTNEAKFVRRELLDRLEKLLEKSENLELSEGTGAKRGVVHNFVYLMLLASGTLAALMTYRVFLSETPDWHLLTPLAGASITFFGTLIYYLKWNDRWFREHAEGELASKRYKSDIIRASWVAELVSEYADESKKELPKELLEAFTRNLFQSVGPVRESEHPMDHLGSLMRRAQEVDFGKGRLLIRGRKDDAPD